MLPSPETISFDDRYLTIHGSDQKTVLTTSCARTLRRSARGRGYSFWSLDRQITIKGDGSGSSLAGVLRRSCEPHVLLSTQNTREATMLPLPETISFDDRYLTIQWSDYKKLYLRPLALTPRMCR